MGKPEGSANDRPMSRRANVHVAWTLLALAVLGLIAYANCLDNPLIIDDRILIEDDPRIQEGRTLELATGEYWPGAHGNRLYRPLTSLSLAASWALTPTPRGLRLPNLALHVGCGLLVWMLAVRLTGSTVGGFAAAALFVVHPIHTNCLNSAVDRAEIAAAFFSLLTLLLVWPDRRQMSDRPRVGGWRGNRVLATLAACVCFGAALLFKENAITTIGILLLADLCVLGGPGEPVEHAHVADITDRRRSSGPPSSWRRWVSSRLIPYVIPLVVVAAGYVTLRAAVLPSVSRPVEDIPVVDNIIAHPEYGLSKGDSVVLARWGTPVAVFGKAAGLLLIPEPLCWDYSYAAIDSVKRAADPRFVFGALVLSALVGVGVASYRRRRGTLFAIGLFIIAYSLTSNTFLVIGTVFAERYLYLPSVGFCLLIGVLSAHASASFSAPARTSARAVAGLVLVLLGVGLVVGTTLTIERNRDFSSEARLDRVDLETNPRSCRLLTAVASDLYAAGSFGGAIEHATRAAEICPEFATAWQVAGLSQWRRGRVREALPLLTRAVHLGAGHSEQVAVAIADIHKTAGDYQAAIEVLRDFVQRDPGRSAAGARNNLAWYLITAYPPALRDPARALAFARQAVEIQPGQADSIDTLIAVLVALDRHDEAITTLRQLLPTVGAEDPGRPGLIATLAALERR